MAGHTQTSDFGADVSENRQALPGETTLLWYETGRVLGQGGFGITYLARDRNLDQLVAIKEFFPDDLVTREQRSLFVSVPRNSAAAYNSGLKRFIREARTLSRFKHPNIVRVSNVFQCNNTAYMVMDYEEGESLESLFENGKCNTEQDLLGMAVPILDGLQAVHAAGFVHCDIKPANIYTRVDGSPVLLDFGSARQTVRDEQSTRTTTRLVTPAYAPFEQYASAAGKQGPWSDIYSLGATLYNAVTGDKPTDALTRGVEIAQHGIDPYQPALATVRGRYSDAFLQAVDCALRFHPDHRPQSTGEWLSMLKADSVVDADDRKVSGDLVDTARVWLKALPPAITATAGRTIDARASTEGVYRIPGDTTTASVFSVDPQSKPRVSMGVKPILAIATPVFVALIWFVIGYVQPGDTDSEQTDVHTIVQVDRTAELNQALVLASQLMAKDKLDEARVHLQTVAAIEPDDINLARLRIELTQRERELEIDSLLERAAKRLAEELPSASGLSSALVFYRQVLALQPDNETARAGVEAVAVKQRESELATWLVRADEHLAAGRLAQPVGDNALEGYRQVLASDSQNALARRGVQQVVQRLLDMADELITNGVTDSAIQQLAIVEKIDADNLQVASLRARIDESARVAEARRQQAVEAKRKRAAERERLAREKKAQESRARIAVSPGQSDAERVTGIVEEFRAAFEQRDIERLQGVAHLSAERRRFIEDLFGRYKAIELSISELALQRSGSASARITIEKLITNDGDKVAPAASWKQTRLVTVKKGEHWQKLSW